METNVPANKYIPFLETVRYSIDLTTAILLLTGQISTVGLFVVEKGFFLTSTGPILGGHKVRGKTGESVVALDVIDIVAALLLILDAIRVTGVYVTSGSTFITFSGAIFGIPRVPRAKDPFQPPPATKESQQLRDYVKKSLLDRL